MPSDPLEAWAKKTEELGFAVVGLGGAGCDAVQDLVDLGSPGVRTFAINTDAQHLRRLPIEQRILVGERRLRGRGSGGDRAAVLDASEDGLEEIVRRLGRYE
ncbi:MAG TPA: hypothetical protein VLY85_00025, partial [Thermoplasmata archaeon]|nr:hypothetical protein [Thermoplasmata archaeon]